MFFKLYKCHHYIGTLFYDAVWNRDELRQALMPPLEKLYKLEPESLPFRQPVDPEALAIPVRCQLFTTADLIVVAWQEIE